MQMLNHSVIYHFPVHHCRYKTHQNYNACNCELRMSITWLTVTVLSQDRDLVQQAWQDLEGKEVSSLAKLGRKRAISIL